MDEPAQRVRQRQVLRVYLLLAHRRRQSFAERGVATIQSEKRSGALFESVSLRLGCSATRWRWVTRWPAGDREKRETISTSGELKWSIPSDVTA